MKQRWNDNCIFIMHNLCSFYTFWRLVQEIPSDKTDIESHRFSLYISRHSCIKLFKIFWTALYYHFRIAILLHWSHRLVSLKERYVQVRVSISVCIDVDFDIVCVLWLTKTLSLIISACLSHVIKHNHIKTLKPFVIAVNQSDLRALEIYRKHLPVFCK